MKIWKFWKHRSFREEELYKRLKSFLATYNADIVSFSYYPKIFGDIVITVDYDGSIYEFITDRGEIWCNDRCICDNSYHRAGQCDTVDQLMIIMKGVFEGGSTQGNRKS